MISTIIRFIVSALVLMLVSFITPGFAVAGFRGALLAALAIAALGWVATAIIGPKGSPYGRGVLSFISSVVVLYVVGMFFPNWVHVTLIGAIIAAFIIGLIDAVVTTTLR
jgi:putative membrane protein